MDYYCSISLVLFAFEKTKVFVRHQTERMDVLYQVHFPKK